LARHIGDTARYALESWSRTFRLCVFVIATGVAAGMYSLIRGG
jgi:hypothetical protein